MSSCMCGKCQRDRRIRRQERSLRRPAPALPPTVGVSQRETLRMIVERMRWLRAAGWLEREIADHLNDYELHTPSWRCCWTQASVSYWLRHEAYPSGRAA